MKAFELILGAQVAIALALAAVRSARFGVASWLLVVCLVPSWLMVRVGPEWTPAALYSVVLIPAAYIHRGARHNRVGDTLVAAFFALCVVAAWQGGTPRAIISLLITRGLGPYVVGRWLVPAAGVKWSSELLAKLMIGCALWSIAEYLTGAHIFEQFHLASPEGFWAQIQFRGGHARSEGAFGHAIALGGALAMAVPFVLTSRWRLRAKLFGFSILTLGVVATISRGPMTAVLLGAALVVILYVGDGIARRQRAALTAAISLASVMIYFFAVARISSAGTEATTSAAYRGSLYSAALQDVRPLSRGANVLLTHNGQLLYRQFGSVDSSFLYLALFFGWIPILVAGIGAIALLANVARRRRHPAAIAVIAQLPVLATLALITQYSSLMFFLLGFAVAEAGVHVRQHSHTRARLLSPLPPISYAPISSRTHN